MHSFSSIICIFFRNSPSYLFLKRKYKTMHSSIINKTTAIQNKAVFAFHVQPVAFLKEVFLFHIYVAKSKFEMFV